MSETTINATAHINGYDFARSIIDQKGDEAIGILLECAKKTEGDWFEKKASVYRSETYDEKFKRAMERCPSDRREQRKEELNLELLAEIACAIVALHNSRGGVLLIGIDDKTNSPVSFEDNEGGRIWKENDKGDYALKAVLGRIVREGGEFKCGNTTFVIPIKDVDIVPKWCRYMGADVLALLVPSRSLGKAPLIVQEIKNNSPHPYPPMKTPGDVGRVEKGRNNDKWIGSASQLEDFHEKRLTCFLNRDDLSFMLRDLGISTSSISDFLVSPPNEVFSSVQRPGATNFVGRVKELTDLHDLLQAGRIPIVTGPAGTGKSELAFQYAERHQSDYPGGLFQINMESAETWEDALRFDLWRSSANGVSPQRILGLEKKGEGKEEPADSSGRLDSNRIPFSGKVLQALRNRVNSEGDVLLVLDNVESTRTFFRRQTLEKLNLPAGVHMVATARSCDIIIRPSDHAIEMPLPDLSLDETLDFLLKERPAESTNEHQAAEEVARLLDFHPLHLITVPAKLDDPYSPFANSYMALAGALREKLLETVEDAMKDYGEEERIPSVLWKLTQETMLRHPGGTSFVKLAHVASFLTPVGSRMLILLRHLWGALVAPDANAERDFEQAVNVLRLHGILSGPESDNRMHSVTAEILRKSARTTDANLEEAIGKVLGGYDGMGPMDWLALADNVSITKFTPKGILLTNITFYDIQEDISVQVRMLLKNPEFHIAMHWDALTESDMEIICSELPQFANKCDRRKFNRELFDHCYLANRIRVQPQNEDRCSLDKFDAQDRALPLVEQPQYADRCPWEKLDGHAWALLLSDQPQFGEKCPWEKLDEWDWVELLEAAPRFAEHCPWSLLQSKIDTDTWVIWICNQPEFASHCPWDRFEGKNWAELLCKAPQFADRCSWDKLDGQAWGTLLAGQPQFADRCPWNKLDGQAWGTLLAGQPQFANRCPWDKLDGQAWGTLLAGQPQFAETRFLYDWRKLNASDWVVLLNNQPQFSDHCPWQDFKAKDWVDLLRFQPQYAEKCPWKRIEFDGAAWGTLLDSQPQFVDLCPFEKFGEWDWADYLFETEYFVDRCPWDSLSGPVLATVISFCPYYSGYCHWEKFDGDCWAHLLAKQPQFAERCAWEKLTAEDWAYLLKDQPQFADRCPLPKEQLNHLVSMINANQRGSSDSEA